MSQTPVEWKGPVEGYVVNFLNVNHWRVEASMTRLDAMQEAYIIYMRCCRKYPEVEAKHFMALFKTTWFNHFTDLSNIDTVVVKQPGGTTKRVKLTAPIPTRVDGEVLELTGETDNDGMLSIMIQQAPREVSMVLALFLNAPTELLDMALASWNAKGDKRKRHGGSIRINRLLGLPEDLDSMKMVSDYFKQ